MWSVVEYLFWRIVLNQYTLPAGRYRHYKGKDYQVLNVVTHSETNEPLVLYRCLYGDYSIWVRPYSMFIETVEVNGESKMRFEYIEAMDSPLENR